MAMRFLCFVSCCFSLSIIFLTVDFTGSWLQLHSLFLLPFCGSLLALSSSLVSQFLQFDVATRPLAPLQQQVINLHKHTQLFVTGYFNCIPKWDGCLHTSHTFSCNPKEGRKLGPHTPTENTHCKIRSLALRCSAMKLDSLFSGIMCLLRSQDLIKYSRNSTMLPTIKKLCKVKGTTLQISKRADMKWSNYKHENAPKVATPHLQFFCSLCFVLSSKLHRC